ncbi:uncharacterized protein LOC126739311 [Anthonomus grandis grandis]|uniref:uncharacterized protein LOC126739311 n=1 Tax=Anthonomus grandis grandis TaxID=2921223 RepID=UPI00216540BD|nr:uncharacterized protein LOC126739311 [Anthonomus grandis grandis]
MRGYSRGYSRGNSYRGSNRGYGSRREPRDSFNSSYESGHGGGGRGYENKSFSERYSRDEYPKAYRVDNYSRHSPERKRMRHEGSSRNEYGGGYESYPVERRAYSRERERYPPSSSRREDFRKPPPLTPRGGGGRGGRINSRGSRGIRGRERGRRPSGRLLSSRSYGIRKRGLVRREYSTRGSSRLVRIRSTVRRKKNSDSSENESDEESKAKKEDEEAAEGEDAEMNEEEEKEGEEETETKEAEEKKESPKKKTKKTPEKPEKKFIVLRCPRCNVKAPTFRSYEIHLQTGSHLFNMRKVASKHRTILAQMRNAQRLAQNELEKSGEGITDHTVFCPLCKLNYKQERAVHQGTAAHKNMRKFLMPSCKVCDVTFKSPMVYEHHLCSIDHLKRKQQAEEGDSKGDEEDTLDDFTTIDSVGDIVDDNSPDDEEVKKKKKDRVYHGIELVKKVDAWYCDLCRMFLPRCTENESPDIISGHCLKRFHVQRFTRQKENAELKKKAEKMVMEVPKKKKEEVKKEEDETEDAEMSEVKEDDGKEKLDDDKMWDAVDKDLGELLEETDGKDDDDDVGERYDRFKSTEKEKNGEGAEVDAEKSEEVKTDEAKK